MKPGYQYSCRSWTWIYGPCSPDGQVRRMRVACALPKGHDGSHICHVSGYDSRVAKSRRLHALVEWTVGE